MPSPADDDAYEDDLDARLASVLEEKGIALPPALEARARPARAAGTAPSTAVPAPPPKAAPAGVEAAPRPAARRGGRREKTMLLGLLGTLAGAFAGVLSMKLFVPRPPIGTGPDVHVAAAAAEPLAIVDPPELTAPPQAPPSKPDPFLALGLPPAADTGLDAAAAPPAAAGSRFASLDDPLPPPGEPPLPPAAGEAWRHDGAASVEPAAFVGLPPAEPALLLEDGEPLPAAPGRVVPAAALMPAAIAPIHVVREGDSWWAIAEAAYGDGRYYKALFAWNRSLDPRTSLTPGTRLDVPDEAQLRAAWGRLVPDPGR